MSSVIDTLLNFGNESFPGLGLNLEGFEPTSDEKLSLVISYDPDAEVTKAGNEGVSKVQQALSSELSGYDHPFYASITLKPNGISSEDDLSSLEDYVQENKEDLIGLIDKSRADK